MANERLRENDEIDSMRLVASFTIFSLILELV
jgi:hypothetical protein